MKNQIEIEMPFTILMMVNCVNCVGPEYWWEPKSEKEIVILLQDNVLKQMSKLYCRNYKYQN